jgi:hypothetical protein
MLTEKNLNFFQQIFDRAQATIEQFDAPNEEITSEKMAC